MKTKINIGTRGSPLALAQAELLASALRHAHPHLAAPESINFVIITTTGDRIQDRPLSEVGGKGLFTKEIEEALLDGSIDAAVHSMKDMPTELPTGLVIPCLLPREDVRDAFFSRSGETIDTLPAGAVVGTSSLRRQAIILARRPDLKVVMFRGNVGTRLQKLQDGVVDATLLAVAGLNRLGKSDLIQTALEPDVMLPAVAQGTVGIEIREKDTEMAALLAPVHCAVTALRTAAERAFLAAMDGSCKTPLAALMSVPDPEGRARFDALSANPDGTGLHRVSYLMQVLHEGDAERLGQRAAADIRAKLAAA
ncbi:MAG: hydroxymethylbilane synthase [Alphaproteobacteria bacterium]|nr:hydroxymethylbilane synthase [Alphaproteobacteria bacterium]